MNIPLEKVKSFTPQTTTLYQQNSFLPVREHNQIYSAGYFSELETFLQLCEDGNAINESSLESLIPTYEAFELLKNSKSKR
jgi:virulence factor